jgi:cyclopropane-fatty-acyl-phospholipid synthase
VIGPAEPPLATSEPIDLGGASRDGPVSMLIAAILRSIVRRGSLSLIDATGHEHRIGDGSPPSVAIRLASRRLGWSLALDPALSIGEAFMDGTLTVERGTLYEFLAVVARNVGSTGSGNRWLRLFEHVRGWWRQSNPADRARRNVAHHYDLTEQFYELFLDSDRQYSCAYFRHADESIETAQQNKKRHLAAKLLLDRPGLRLLDIGSGWGGLGLYLADLAGASVTGVTLSTEQHRVSQERVAKAGLADRVAFHLRDYRDETGPYDRIVSVGMFEHVGKRNYAEFFAKLHDLLADDGVAVLHTIGYVDHPGPINPFISRYIFPGADVPALSEIMTRVERSGLIVTDVEVLRLHYAETLRCWRERFMARRDEAVALYDERFCRMWEYYLALCEVGFRYRTSVVFQLQLAKRLDTVPITRDYIAAAERDAAAAPESRAA